MKIVLGSSSPRRKQVLESMGLEFEVIAPDIDEKAIRDPDPLKLVCLIANAKADAVIAKLAEPAIVIASDLVVIWQGQIIEKPESKEQAREWLKHYHESPAATAVAMTVVNTKTGARAQGSDQAKIYFQPLSEEIIEAVINDGVSMGAAGGFVVVGSALEPYLKIEGEIESVMGLPKTLTEKLLQEVS